MKPITEPATLTSATFEDLVKEMLVRLGEDPEREGLLRTPARVHKAFEFLTRGYNEDPETMLKNALFTVSYDEMVIVKDVEVFSLCEHHILPFFGKVHVAYIPNGKVIGLSKIPRLIEIFSSSRRLGSQRFFRVVRRFCQSTSALRLTILSAWRACCCDCCHTSSKIEAMAVPRPMAGRVASSRLGTRSRISSAA